MEYMLRVYITLEPVYSRTVRLCRRCFLHGSRPFDVAWGILFRGYKPEVILVGHLQTVFRGISGHVPIAAYVILPFYEFWRYSVIT